MPDKVCLGCGGSTNTAVCDYAEHSDLEPRKCYAKWDGKWIAGCALNELPEGSLTRMFAEKVIAGDKWTFKRSALCDLSDDDFQELLNRHTMTEIGEMYGISRERVRQHKVKRGLKRVATRGWRITDGELRELLVGHTGAEVARLVGVQPNVVYYHAKKLGIRLRRYRGPFDRYISAWITPEQYQHLSNMGSGTIASGLRTVIDQHIGFRELAPENPERTDDE